MTCYGNCPSDKVCVASDIHVLGCNYGSSVRCCSPKQQTITKRDTDENSEFENYLRDFKSNNWKCSSDDESKEYKEEKILEDYISGIIYGTLDNRRVEIWDDMVGVPYSHLKVASLQK